MIRGFIRVATEAGPILLGIAQIVSISHGLSKRGRSTDIRMGDGSTCVALGSVDDMLDLIEEAELEPEAEVAEPSPPVPTPSPTPPMGEGAIGAAMQQADVKKEVKKRGRPPKATPQQ